MSEPKFLLVRLGSMGDVIHALPAASALRDTFPAARIDWVIDPKWARLLEGNPDLTETITLDRKNLAGIFGAARMLRQTGYSCVIDFQGLYKSALLAAVSGAPKRIGFASSYAREGLAAAFYTDRLKPWGAHKVDHNLTLAEFAGARRPACARFPMAPTAQDEEVTSRELARHGFRGEKEFYVLNPGGGWKSKCWPAERFGGLHARVSEKWGWQGLVAFGPGEEALASEVVTAGGKRPPVAVPLSLGPLMAVMQRARLVISADTGPLHLAAALKTPVVGLFGPTDPARNGPYHTGVVVRNLRNCITNYRREKDYAASMLQITVEQVLAAVETSLSISA